MKEKDRRTPQTLIRAVSHETMTAEEQSQFNKAVEQLLA
jgi:hypothetical protein